MSRAHALAASWLATGLLLGILIGHYAAEPRDPPAQVVRCGP